MASKDELTDEDIAHVCCTLSSFSVTSGAGKGDPDTFNSKACAKMVKDCLPKEVVTMADASVFPKYKEKGKQHMNLKDNIAVKGFVCDLAHEYVKLKSKNPRLQIDDQSVKHCSIEFAEKIAKGNPIIKEIKTSKTGHVSSLTDTSKYTGSHKERFDETGHGKGAAGRVNKVENTGYVHNYRDEGTYDERH